MKVLNFGSLNLDHVYSLDHIVQPGETISASNVEVFCGGKGLNQSVAFARMGVPVCHAGMIGPDGDMLLQACRENGVDTSFIRTLQAPTGHAIIQLATGGQNSIVLFGGANRKNEKNYVDAVLSHFSAGDMLVLQNEINLLDYLIERAAQHGMVIALNPSPYNEAVKRCDLKKVSYFIINEVEGSQMTGANTPDAILSVMRRNYERAKIVLTLGKAGAVYQDDTKFISHGVYEVPVVDTTAAGDTFTGYFLGSITQGQCPEAALHIASLASSLAVSEKGALPSIPHYSEVKNAEKKLRLASNYQHYE